MGLKRYANHATPCLKNLTENWYKIENMETDTKNETHMLIDWLKIEWNKLNRKWTI